MSLSQYAVGTAVAVSDIERAKQFYEDKLGLENPDEQGDGGYTYSCGDGTSIHIYPSESASPSGATVAFWEVEDIEKTVDELSSNGVTFEQYDMDELKTDEKGIADLGDSKTAWFKDPDGNVLAAGTFK